MNSSMRNFAAGCKGWPMGKGMPGMIDQNQRHYVRCARPINVVTGWKNEEKNFISVYLLLQGRYTMSMDRHWPVYAIEGLCRAVQQRDDRNNFVYHIVDRCAVPHKLS